MIWKHMFFIFSATILLCSCSTIDKAMHLERYCIEKNCHQKRMENSVYCSNHYESKIKELVKRADQAKKEETEAEKRKEQQK